MRICLFTRVRGALLLLLLLSIASFGSPPVKKSEKRIPTAQESA
jgi:hypothetical protein